MIRFEPTQVVGRLNGVEHSVPLASLDTPANAAATVADVNARLTAAGHNLHVAYDFNYGVVWMGPLSEQPWGGAAGYTPPE